MEKTELLEQIQNLKSEYGDWTFDIPLPFDVWTKGNQKIPHTRLRRIVQTVSDIVAKPFSECRVLDLGSLDGIFPIEFALQGAETVGVEIREANIKKAIFCKEALNLDNLEFRQDDARNISVESYGKFDAIVCSGLLYHLTASDTIDLISKMFEMATKVVVIDTHIALKPEIAYSKNNIEYWGKNHVEHSEGDSQEKKSKNLWASWDNNDSFWFTRPSLINIMNEAGFGSVYECFTPAHLNFGQPGIEHLDRCTIVGIKGSKCELHTSPVVNDLHETWSENSLDYNPNETKTFHKSVMAKPASLAKRAISKMKRMGKK